MAIQYGTAEEAKAMLEKAVAAVKENKAKALDMFNKGEGGFKDRDLYVFCANASALQFNEGGFCWLRKMVGCAHSEAKAWV